MSEDLRQVALLYHSFGFNVTHVIPQKQKNKHGELEFTLKKPSHSIENLIEKKQSLHDVLSFEWENASGVGAVMGFENLRSIDFDGCTDEEFIHELLIEIGLPSDYEWVTKTGSGNGFQIIIYSPDLSDVVPQGRVLTRVPNISYMKKFEHVELIWSGNHVLLPPSLHISGKKYEFINNQTPSSRPQTIDIVRLETYIDSICFNRERENNNYSFSDNFNSDEYAFNREMDSFGGQDHKGYYKEPIYWFIDVETNGLPKPYTNPETNPEAFPEIIQFAALKCDSTGKRYTKFNAYVTPRGWKIKPEIEDFINMDALNKENGYCDLIKLENMGNVLSDKQRWYFYFSSFQNKFNCMFGMWEDKYENGYLVGHNLDFDLNCLKAIYYRQKRRYEEHIKPVIDKPDYFSEQFDKYFFNRISKLKKICTMKSTTKFCGLQNSKGYKYPKLEELYFKLFGEKMVNTHDASVDAYTTAKCYWKLRDLGEIE